ncbi:MAG: hypothetical protein LBF23_00860 [Endomicrobium sp.]|jgi:hypothetical protein|nr:hypothetical protein [Endomicrobium sp.]
MKKYNKYKNIKKYMNYREVMKSIIKLYSKEKNMAYNAQVLQMLGNMEYSLNYEALNTTADGQVTFRNGDNKTNFMFTGCKNRYDIVSRCQECMRWAQKNNIDGSTGVVALSDGNEYNFNFGS